MSLTVFKIGRAIKLKMPRLFQTILDYTSTLLCLPSAPVCSQKWLAMSKAAGPGPPYSRSIKTTCTVKYQKYMASKNYMYNLQDFQNNEEK